MNYEEVFFTKRKPEKNKRVIKVYKTHNGEPIYLGWVEVRIYRESEIERAFQLLIDKKEIPEKYRYNSYYELMHKYRIYELPY